MEGEPIVINDRTIPQIEYSSLIEEGKLEDGLIKVTYRARTPEGNLVAVKIYQEDRISSSKIRQRAIKEFSDYLFFLNHPRFRDYTPQPLFFATDNGKLIGLAVEYKEGETFDKARLSSSLLHPILELRAAFLSILADPSSPLFDIEMYQPHNLIVSGTRIWFCECSTIDRSKANIDSIGNALSQINAILIRRIRGAGR